VPNDGPAILVCNHQSYVDPVVIGTCLNRPCTFVARKSLFKPGWIDRLLRQLNGIPIDREGSSLDGIRQIIKRLKMGDLVVLFPEGTRTKDGEVQPLKPGIALMARRAKAPVIPMAIDGAFEVLPRTGWLLRPAQVHVTFGAPLTPEEVKAMKADDLLVELHSRMAACHDNSRRIIRGG